MSTLSSHLFSYHVEIILIPRTPDIFNKILQGSMEEMNLEDYSDGSYVDTFWDTSSGDLHADGLTLRSRVIEDDRNEIHLNYKSSGTYINQLLFSRKYGSALFRSEEELNEAVRLQAPSEPIQMLFSDRPDLLGYELHPRGQASVRSRSFRVYLREKPKEIILSFHSYSLSSSNDEFGKGYLVEIQPTFSAGNNLLRYGPQFREVRDFLQGVGFVQANVGKYHRIPRAGIDAVEL